MLVVSHVGRESRLLVVSRVGRETGVAVGGQDSAVGPTMCYHPGVPGHTPTNKRMETIYHVRIVICGAATEWAAMSVRCPREYARGAMVVEYYRHT